MCGSKITLETLPEALDTGKEGEFLHEQRGAWAEDTRDEEEECQLSAGINTFRCVLNSSLSSSSEDENSTGEAIGAREEGARDASESDRLSQEGRVGLFCDESGHHANKVRGRGGRESGEIDVLCRRALPLPWLALSDIPTSSFTSAGRGWQSGGTKVMSEKQVLEWLLAARLHAHDDRCPHREEDSQADVDTRCVIENLEAVLSNCVDWSSRGAIIDEHTDSHDRSGEEAAGATLRLGAICKMLPPG